MSAKEQFALDVQDAYRHLYDFVHLRSHPLLDWLLPGVDLDTKELAWRLHEQLLRVIDELDPGPQSPVFSQEWRRHRLMVLRYVNGLGPQECADQLSVSRRQFYREHEIALSAVVDLLWARRAAPPLQKTSVPGASSGASEHSSLLRQEALRITRKDQGANVVQVVDAVIPLLQALAGQKQIQLIFDAAQHAPAAIVDAAMLRQVLIGVLGSLIEHVGDVNIRLTLHTQPSAVNLAVYAECKDGSTASMGEEWQHGLAAVKELAGMNNVDIAPLTKSGTIIGVELRLPRGRQNTILVVDDNEDMLLLFQRYLAPYPFHILTAQTGAEAIEAVKQLRPDLIILDLMMPEQDGWDLLQQLRSRPAAMATPVMVCSVLQQRELVLALGANAFLPKPIDQETLISTVKQLID